MLKHITLRQIEVFRALVETHTVSAAAVVLGISQPAVSKSIAQLEKDAGMQLFDRVRGRLVPGRQGMRLYEEIARIFAGVDQVARAVELIRNEKDRLLVAVLPGLGDRFIHAVARHFLDQRDDVFLSIITRDSPTIMNLVSAGEVDIGIVSGEFASPVLRAKPLFRTGLICAMPRRHALARRKQIHAEDLHGHRYIAFSQQTLRTQIDSFLHAQGVEPDHVLEAGSAPTVCEFISSGFGLSVLHPLMAMSASTRMTVRPIVDAPEMEFAFVTAQASRKTDLIEAFSHSVQRTGDALLAYLVPGRTAA
jgi:DNA-binding transcriptional LysR family regulator